MTHPQPGDPDASEAQGRPRTWRRFADDVLVPFLATRLVLVLVGWLAIALLPISRWVPPEWGLPGVHPIVDALSRWDATNNLRIAVDGYLVSQPSDAAFFPLYPLLIMAGATTIGPAGHEIAALVIANVALLGALAALLALVDLDHDAPTARRTVLYVLVFPTSFFLSAGYAESLLLFFSVTAIVAGRRGRWWLAGGLGALAALTRPLGLLVVVPLAIEAYQQRHARSAWLAAPALLLVVLALLAYGTFLGSRYGDVFAFLDAQTSWDRHLMPPWQTLADFFSRPLSVHSGLHSSVDLAFTVFGIAVAIAAWRVLRPSYAAYLTALIVVPLCTGVLLSMPRFLVTAFPIFLVLALAGRNAAFDRFYVIFGVGLGACFMALFATWYWVA